MFRTATDLMHVVDLFTKGGLAASALTLSRHCLAIIAGPNEPDEAVTQTSSHSVWRPFESHTVFLH